MKVLLDTNAYSALRRGHELVADQVRSSEEVLLSSIVIGELLFGFRNGSRYDENAQALRSFIEDPNVRLLPVTWDTADLFGRISAELRKKGRPIPTNDIWIAAHAMEVGADLISSDPHFGYADSARNLAERLIGAAKAAAHHLCEESVCLVQAENLL